MQLGKRFFFFDALYSSLYSRNSKLAHFRLLGPRAKFIQDLWLLHLQINSPKATSPTELPLPFGNRCMNPRQLGRPLHWLRALQVHVQVPARVLEEPPRCPLLVLGTSPLHFLLFTSLLFSSVLVQRRTLPKLSSRARGTRPLRSHTSAPPKVGWAGIVSPRAPRNSWRGTVASLNS